MYLHTVDHTLFNLQLVDQLQLSELLTQCHQTQTSVRTFTFRSVNITREQNTVLPEILPGLAWYAANSETDIALTENID